MAKHSVVRAAKTARTEDAKARDAALHRTADSYQNFATAIGIGTPNLSSGGGYGYNPVTRIRTLLEWIHRGSWLGGVAIDVVGDDMTKMGVDLRGDIQPDDIEHLDRAATTWGLWNSINDTVKWSRLYGGCVAMMMIDGQRPETPLRLDTIGKGAFKGLLVLDRWMVEPSLNDLVTDMGPDIGLPKYYMVTADAPAQPRMRIHYSRCLRLEGIRLPYWQRLSENLWGISVLERLYDRMLAFDSGTQGAAQLLYKAYIRTYKVEGLRDVVSSGGESLKGLTNQVNFMRATQSQEGITLIDGKDDFQTYQYSFAGISDVLLQFGQQLSGALQIPLVRLFGQSPAGLSATGESDLRMYYDGIHQQQEKVLRVPVTKMYRALAASEGIKLDEGFTIDFRPLWQLTAAEKVQTAAALVGAVTGAFDAGIIDRGTALNELRQGSKLTGVFTNITDEQIKAAEEEPPPGSLEAMGQQMELQNALAPEPEEEAPKPGAKKPAKKAKTKDVMLGDRNVLGFPVVIEHERGTERYGRILPADYGYIRLTDSAERGDAMDCFVGTDKNSTKVFIVDSYDLEGWFDEHKVIFYAPSAEVARKIFQQYYFDRRGIVTEITGDLLRSFTEVDGPFMQPTDVEYCAPAPEPEKEKCSLCRKFVAPVYCAGAKVVRDPKIPDAGDGLKVISPGGICKEFELKKEN